jgi:hypothetical protein
LNEQKDSNKDDERWDFTFSVFFIIYQKINIFRISLKMVHWAIVT